jgi:hypothetical protein
VVERALAEVMAAMQARRVDKDVNRSQTGRRDRALA